MGMTDNVLKKEEDHSDPGKYDIVWSYGPNPTCISILCMYVLSLNIYYSNCKVV